ncbi:unnamed protein product [Prorocentrum cordatum]|uniref:SbsA Ig-like domain-containing protein n=1 Tax=Prorocentrum cordatum TaxID=2364126 RepID=A0ABN9ULC6_9DINO|nr:unnamed protein product [Polarella glacialis]
MVLEPNALEDFAQLGSFTSYVVFTVCTVQFERPSTTLLRIVAPDPLAPTSRLERSAFTSTMTTTTITHTSTTTATFTTDSSTATSSSTVTSSSTTLSTTSSSTSQTSTTTLSTSTYTASTSGTFTTSSVTSTSMTSTSMTSTATKTTITQTSVPGCFDSSPIGGVDLNGYDCEVLEGPFVDESIFCGHEFDDTDFTALDMCCICGGGGKQTYTATTSTRTSVSVTTTTRTTGTHTTTLTATTGTGSTTESTTSATTSTSTTGSSSTTLTSTTSATTFTMTSSTSITTGTKTSITTATSTSETSTVTFLTCEGKTPVKEWIPRTFSVVLDAGAITDVTGNGNSAVASYTFSHDNVPPSFLPASSHPLPGSAEQATALESLLLYFSEDVAAGAGCIEIWEEGNAIGPAFLIDVVDVDKVSINSALSFLRDARVVVTPKALCSTSSTCEDLAVGTTYYLATSNPGVLMDAEFNQLPQLNTSGLWAFTVGSGADAPPPEVVFVAGSDASGGVLTGYLQFSRRVWANPSGGNLTITDCGGDLDCLAEGDNFLAAEVAPESCVYGDGSTPQLSYGIVKFVVSVPTDGRRYLVRVGANMVQDDPGADRLDVQRFGPHGYYEYEVDAGLDPGPALDAAASHPAHGDSDVATTENVILAFNQAVRFGRNGTLELWDAADSSGAKLVVNVLDLAASDASRSFISGRHVHITPRTLCPAAPNCPDLEAGVTYYLRTSVSGVLLDDQDRELPVLNTYENWSFTTASSASSDLTPPEVAYFGGYTESTSTFVGYVYFTDGLASLTDDLKFMDCGADHDCETWADNRYVELDASTLNASISGGLWESGLLSYSVELPTINRRYQVIIPEGAVSDISGNAGPTENYTFTLVHGSLQAGTPVLRVAGFLSTVCDVGFADALGRVSASMGGRTDSVELEIDDLGRLWTMLVDASMLTAGIYYRVCVDLDGSSAELSYGDAGLQVLVTGVSKAPYTIRNFADQVLAIECASGCSTASLGYLGIDCESSVRDGALQGRPPHNSPPAHLAQVGGTAWALPVNATDFALGARYRLCLDVDGTADATGFADTGLTVFSTFVTEGDPFGQAVGRAAYQEVRLRCVSGYCSEDSVAHLAAEECASAATEAAPLELSLDAQDAHSSRETWSFRPAAHTGVAVFVSPFAAAGAPSAGAAAGVQGRVPRGAAVRPAGQFRLTLACDTGEGAPELDLGRSRPAPGHHVLPGESVVLAFDVDVFAGVGLFELWRAHANGTSALVLEVDVATLSTVGNESGSLIRGGSVAFTPEVLCPNSSAGSAGCLEPGAAYQLAARRQGVLRGGGGLAVGPLAFAFLAAGPAERDLRAPSVVLVSSTSVEDAVVMREHPLQRAGRRGGWSRHGHRLRTWTAVAPATTKWLPRRPLSGTPTAWVPWACSAWPRHRRAALRTGGTALSCPPGCSWTLQATRGRSGTCPSRSSPEPFRLLVQT